jgi:hypothetical protein
MSQTVILSGPYQKSVAKRLIDSAPVDAVVTIKPANRSTDQNKLMWALLSEISRAKPMGRCHTPETWKELLMHACGWAVQFEMGLNGQPFPVGFRSSRLSKAQMTDFIEYIYAFAAEHEITLHDEAA